METLGGPAFNGVGFSFGLDRLLLTLGDTYKFEGPNLMVVVSEEDKKELFKEIIINYLIKQITMKN